MDISPRKPSRRVGDPVDEWLRGEGFVRKHSPNDASCLFKAVSEQLFSTQYYHPKVRVQCIDFMRQNHNLYEKDIKHPYDDYLDRMLNTNEWPGDTELQAMALLYKRDFIIYNGMEMTRSVVTNNGSDKFFYLCKSSSKHYESIFPKESISSAAYCQSIVYHTLYQRVFQLDGVDESVNQMLHDRSVNIRHDKFFLKSNIDVRDELTDLLRKADDKKAEDGSTVELANPDVKTPFPYRIAKALDPNIYRNTDFDIWQEFKREVRSSSYSRWNSSGLQVGCKCYVVIEPKDIKKDNNDDEDDKKNILAIENNDDTKEEDNDNAVIKKAEVNKKLPKKMIGHIQSMSANKGPVVVFIEELGDKFTVPYSVLETIPRPKKQPFSTLNVVSLRRNNFTNSQYRWFNTNNNSNSNTTNDKICNRKQVKWNVNRKNKDVNGYDDKLNKSNNSEVDHNTNVIIKKKENSRWSKNLKSNNTSPSKNPTSIMKKLTSIHNFSPKDTSNSVTTFEVHPAAVVFDNCLPIENPLMIERDNENTAVVISNSASDTSALLSDSTIPKTTTNSTNVSSNSQSDMNDSSKSGCIKSESEASNTLPAARSTPVPPQQSEVPSQQYHPPPQQQQLTGPQMVATNCGYGCVTSEGTNVYPQYTYYGGFVPESSPQVLEHDVNRVNFSPVLSYDINGTDLPMTDLITLRYFYNLGIETYRMGYWQPNSLCYGLSGVMPRSNMMQVMPIPDYQPTQAVALGPQPLMQQTPPPQQQQQQPQQQQQQQQSQPQQQQVSQQQKNQRQALTLSLVSTTSSSSSLQSNNSRHTNNYTNNRRRGGSGEQNNHTGKMTVSNYANQKNSYTRKNDTQDTTTNYHHDESHNNKMYDYKNKNTHANSDNNKDSHVSTRDQKKNTSSSSGSSNVSRYKKQNDGHRNRSYERSVHYQNDYQSKQMNNYQSNNNYNNRNVVDNAGQSSHRGKSSENNNQSQMVNTQTSAISQVSVSSASTGSSSSLPIGGQQAVSNTAIHYYQNYPPPPIYSNVQYVPNDGSTYYPPPSGNYYPVSTIITPQQEIQDGNNQQQPSLLPQPALAASYAYGGPDTLNYPPPMSPMYPYVFTQSPIYQNAPPNQPHDQHWYPVADNQQPAPQFVPSFAQLSITRPPPPNINRQQTSS